MSGMVSITAEMVAAAEVEVTEAEQVRAVAEEALMESPNSTLKAQELASALRRVAQARTNARELREERERQVSAERAAATREELEKAAAKEITAAGRALKAVREELEAKAAEAQAGLVALMEAAEAHDRLVQHYAESLAAQGLGVDGDSGGASGFEGWTVRARGAEYRTAGSGSVLACVAHRVAEARLEYPSVMVGLLEYNAGRVVPEEREDGLFGKLPAPGRRVFPEVPRLRVGG
jgi:colicin import membrane protein